MSWPVGRVLSPRPSRRRGRRPSIWDCRHRQPRAVYPRTRAGRPRSSAQAPPRGRSRPTKPSWPCSGWGLPSHPSHLGCWWSLTPPFHPYLRGRSLDGGL